MRPDVWVDAVDVLDDRYLGAASDPDELETHGTDRAGVDGSERGVDGALGASVDIVWDPPWTPEKMSEAARLELNIG